MGILTRFKDIMASNINALLDKCENPEKMIDQIVRNLQKDLKEVKSETASVMAEESRCKRALEEATKDVEKFQIYAIKALEAGNENDARKFLEEKVKAEEVRVAAEQAFEVAKINSKRMITLHDKLQNDVKTIEARKAAVKAKMKAAKTQQKINKMQAKNPTGEVSMASFDKYEAMANKAMDEAMAMSQLNNVEEDGMDDLLAKYDDNVLSSVDDELAKLKESLNK